MAEENPETKLPQQHIDPQSLLFPPRGSLDHVSGSGTPRKTTWPEVVGLVAEEAERKIKEDMPRARIQVVPPGCFVTMDFNQERVRLHVDSSGKVAGPPRVG
ncbi:subtilisin inhibitor CLSI-I-like [Diospyros lotus]|uniref:subtilisin inhibitor CLSI-I-like n=1 Tax=Diospyros lotus TaxID=55363 RepID=UPI0022592C27|nr:subtilisin inhibitor CLSI-I-like [Diospyros lotus]XP_052174563.1 subtilisin inhibitor CLSI-I-like [Diospyros lotus]